ncbi:MAG: hypothetical protein QW086_00340 [Pyrobaculum sp.]
MENKVSSGVAERGQKQDDYEVITSAFSKVLCRMGRRGGGRTADMLRSPPKARPRRRKVKRSRVAARLGTAFIKPGNWTYVTALWQRRRSATMRW